MASGASNAFDMSKMALGGIGQVLDSVEFVKRAWSTLNIPSQLVPTVDIEELDKRIADLKAVEQWLNVNLSMLHGTIQGLEIQRGTLAAVKAFGASLGALAPQAAARAPAPAPMRPDAPMRATAPAPAARAAAPADDGVAPSVAAPAAGADGASRPATAPGIHAGAWWNLLQHNFNQVAQAALNGGGLPEAALTAAKSAPPRAAKTSSTRPPAAKKRAAPAKKAGKAAA